MCKYAIQQTLPGKLTVILVKKNPEYNLHPHITLCSTEVFVDYNL